MYLFLKSFFIYIFYHIVYLIPVPKNTLRILTLHDINPKHFKILYLKLKALNKKWNFVTPKEFFDKKKIIKGKNILLTFDDGFLSQKKFADQYLDKLGIKAIFFIITDFASIKSKQKALLFIKKNINTELNIDTPHQYLSNMKWNDIRDLLKKKHTIGCHTKSHRKLTKCFTKKELLIEIFKSKKIIKKKIKINVRSFAYPYGDYRSINKDIIKKLKIHYNFIFSGLRGNNSTKRGSLLLMRDAINPDSSLSEINFYLNGWVDKLYFSKYTKLL